MVPCQFRPAVAESPADSAREGETRPSYWQPAGAATALNVQLTRPYTDLAYW